MIGIISSLVFQNQMKKLTKGKIIENDFVNRNKSYPLYYSTPFGDGINGRNQLWVLSSHESEIRYYPVFTSRKACYSFMRMIGRRNFLAIEGNLKCALDSLDSHEVLRDFGIVIDPHKKSAVEISPGIRAK